MNLEAHGHVEPAFEPVREAFAANLRSVELGAALSVWRDGREVVSLWGGHRDEARTLPWREDTLVLVASVTKAFTATCLLQLTARGEVDLDAPVARYWPDFAQAGKAGVTVRHILSHQGGLPTFTQPFRFEDYLDWPGFVRLLERQAPLWPPGARHGYHPNTFGYLVGEVVRRVSGLSLGAYLREHIAGPLGLDFWIGLPEGQHQRCADVSYASPDAAEATPEHRELMRLAAQPGTISNLVLSAAPPPPDAANSAALRSAEMPGSNGHGTASAVGRFYAALAAGGVLDGVRILPERTLRLAREEQVFGPDATVGLTSRFGLGFMLRHELFPIGPSPRAFGHPGAGGHLGFADPDRRLGFGFVMNRGKPAVFGSPSTYRLVETLYACL